MNPSRLIPVVLTAALWLAAGSALAAETYEIDGAHSQVIFKVKHLGVSYQYGRFNDVSGQVVYDEKNPAKSSVEISIKAASVDTANEKRDTHLKGPDFFNAQQFPLLTFKGKTVKKTQENAFEVTGELTVKGVTKPQTLTFTRTGAGPDPWGKYRSGGEAAFSIRRSDFGMNYMPDALGDEVQLLLTFEGVRK